VGREIGDLILRDWGKSGKGDWGLDIERFGKRGGLMIRLRHLLRQGYEGQEGYDGQVVDFGLLIFGGKRMRGAA